MSYWFFWVPLYEWIANRRNSLKLNEAASLKFVFSIFLLMSFGVFFGDVFQTPFYIAWLPYGVAMTCTMIFYFYEAILPVPKGGPMAGWRKNPRFLFLVLMFSFVSELFLPLQLPHSQNYERTHFHPHYSKKNVRIGNGPYHVWYIQNYGWNAGRINASQQC